MTSRRPMIFRALRTTSLLAAATIMIGCGGATGDRKATAPVSGKVTFNGAAVSGGSITLAPIGDVKGPAGKPASGNVQADGTFKLSTYDKNDGAVIGKHRVTYGPPPGETKEGPDGHAAQIPNPLEGMVAKTAEVEIKSGNNELTIEIGK